MLICVSFFFFSAEGSASPQSAGVITALAQQASQLSPEQSTSPVVCLESDKGYRTLWLFLIIVQIDQSKEIHKTVFV